MTRITTAVLAIALTSGAYSATTYVDATHGAGGNTSLVGGAVWNPLTGGAQGVAGDGVWAQRAFGNGATIYQSAANAHIDDAHRLQTMVTGLAAGTYEVYAYVWFVGGWATRASLTNDEVIPLYPPIPAGEPATPLTQFHNGADGTVLSSALDGGNPFTTDVMVSEGNRRLQQISLGQVTGTSFTVYIDDPGLGTDNRSWYDGVGYALVPEPSGSVLILGSLGMLALRRRR